MAKSKGGSGSPSEESVCVYLEGVYKGENKCDCSQLHICVFAQVNVCLCLRASTCVN